MSVTGPHTLEVHSSGVENSSATGRLPSTWLNDTECMFSGGSRVVSRPTLPPIDESVSVLIAGGRCPTPGIGVRERDRDLAGGRRSGDPRRG